MPSGFANHYHNDKDYIKGTRDLAARDDKKHPKKLTYRLHLRAYNPVLKNGALRAER